MADLLDIMPATAVEVVRIDDQRVKVRGLSFPTMAAIIAQFPQLRAIASGEGGDIISRLIAGCGAAIGPIIAAGCGHFGDEEYARRAEALLPEHQLKLLRAIVGLTFPNGIGPFIEELTNLMGGASEAKIIHKVRLKRLPSASPPSSDADSHPTMQ